MSNPLQVPKNLQPPPALTEEELEAVVNEALEKGRLVAEALAKLSPSSDDLKIIIGGYTCPCHGK